MGLGVPCGGLELLRYSPLMRFSAPSHGGYRPKPISAPEAWGTQGAAQGARGGVFPHVWLHRGVGKSLLAAWVKSISLSSVCFWSEQCKPCASAGRKATL